MHQWHVKFAFNYTSQGLIEPQACYFAEIITGASAGIAYKIKGREGGLEGGRQAEEMSDKCLGCDKAY
eukprot:evm.model.NODE_48581_length_41596_cov_62.772526.6